MDSYTTTSPFFSTLPTVSLARSSGVRSGRLYSSIGVGTVTMKTWQRLSSSRSVVKRQARGALELGRGHLERAVAAGLAARAMRAGLDVEADGVEMLAELHRQRQTRRSPADDADAALAQISSTMLPFLGARALRFRRLRSVAGVRGVTQFRCRPDAAPAARLGDHGEHRLVRSAVPRPSAIESPAAAPSMRSGTRTARAAVGGARGDVAHPSSASAPWPPVMARYTSARMRASSSAPCSSRAELSTL